MSMMAIGLGLAAAGGITKLIGNHRRRRAQRKEGLRLAGRHRQNAGDIRDSAGEMIGDIRRAGDQALGSAQHLWGASGARISGDRAELGTDEIDIGTFDREEWMANERGRLTAQLDQLRESDEGSDDSGGFDIRAAGLQAQLRNLDRGADKAEEKWGRRLRDQEAPDLEADINRRVREGDGTLATIQNASLANIERDILRTVDAARRGMSDEYESAAAARRSGESPNALLEDISTILGTAGDMFSAYNSFQTMRPDLGGGGAGRPGGMGILSPQEFRRRNNQYQQFSFFG